MLPFTMRMHLHCIASIEPQLKRNTKLEFDDRQTSTEDSRFEKRVADSADRAEERSRITTRGFLGGTRKRRRRSIVKRKREKREEGGVAEKKRARQKLVPSGGNWSPGRRGEHKSALCWDRVEINRGPSRADCTRADNVAGPYIILNYISSTPVAASVPRTRTPLVFLPSLPREEESRVAIDRPDLAGRTKSRPVARRLHFSIILLRRT